MRNHRAQQAPKLQIAIHQVIRHQLCRGFIETDPVKMELAATIPYKNTYARYNITREENHIYTATLTHFDGSVHDLPPVSITMIKGIRHWIGSTHLQTIVQALGEVIELNQEIAKAEKQKNKDTNCIGEGEESPV